MRELRRLRGSAFENKHMLVCVREMVLPSDNVANAEVDVVGTGCEMVSGHAVGTEEREVFDVVGGFNLLAVDRISKADLLAQAAGNTEAQCERLAGGGPAVAFLAREFAHAGVEEPGLSRAGFFAVAGVSRSKVAISQALLKDGVGDLAVQGQAFGLLVFLVPAEVEPAQPLEDGVNGSVGVALDVGVIQSQDYGSAVATRVEPVEDEGAGAPHVQKTGGRRGESNTKHDF